MNFVKFQNSHGYHFLFLISGEKLMRQHALDQICFQKRFTFAHLVPFFDVLSSSIDTLLCIRQRNVKYLWDYKSLIQFRLLVGVQIPTKAWVICFQVILVSTKEDWQIESLALCYTVIAKRILIYYTIGRVGNHVLFGC